MSNDPSIDELISRFEGYNRTCKDISIDLRHVVFDYEDERPYLDYPPLGKKFFFKTDPSNPTDVKITHALKQFCKFLEVPYKFFLNNRPDLRKRIISNWQAQISAEESGAGCLLRIRESLDYTAIRAMLKESYCTVSNAKILQAIKAVFTPEPEVVFVHGDDRDDLITHVRMILPSDYTASGSVFRIGFSVMMSELGGTPMIIEILVHDMDSKVSFILAYGSGPFFKSKYEEFPSMDLKDIFLSVRRAVEGGCREIIDRISEARKPVSPIDECLKMSRWKSLPSKAKKALYKESEANQEDMNTAYGFAKHLSLISRDYDPKNRLVVERCAGRYLNLVFSAKIEERPPDNGLNDD